MKQLIIVTKDGTHNGGATSPLDLSAFKVGSIGVQIAGASTWAAATPKENFNVIGRHSDDSKAIIIGDIDIATLKATKSAYAAGTPIVKEFTLAAQPDSKGILVKGLIQFDVTVIVTVIGKTFGEKANFTYNARFAKGVAQKDIAADIVKYFTDVFAINGLDINVANTNEKVTFTSTKVNSFFNVTLADSVNLLKVTTTEPVHPCGTKEHIKDLARQCASDMGFEYLGDDEMYAGYPVEVFEDAYDLYTLQFANAKHLAAHTSEEQVNQVLHIAISTAFADKTTLGKVLDDLVK